MCHFFRSETLVSCQSTHASKFCASSYSCSLLCYASSCSIQNGTVHDIAMLTTPILGLVNLQNLERYLHETFPSQTFHVVCSVVNSTNAKIEIIVPKNLENDYGYKIIPDKGYKVRRIHIIYGSISNLLTQYTPTDI